MPLDNTEIASRLAVLETTTASIVKSQADHSAKLDAITSLIAQGKGAVNLLSFIKPLAISVVAGLSGAIMAVLSLLHLK